MKLFEIHLFNFIDADAVPHINIPRRGLLRLMTGLFLLKSFVLLSFAGIFIFVSVFFEILSLFYMYFAFMLWRKVYSGLMFVPVYIILLLISATIFIPLRNYLFIDLWRMI